MNKKDDKTPKKNSLVGEFRKIDDFYGFFEALLILILGNSLIDFMMDHIFCWITNISYSEYSAIYDGFPFSFGVFMLLYIIGNMICSASDWLAKRYNWYLQLKRLRIRMPTLIVLLAILTVIVMRIVFVDTTAGIYSDIQVCDALMVGYWTQWLMKRKRVQTE